MLQERRRAALGRRRLLRLDWRQRLRLRDGSRHVRREGVPDFRDDELEVAGRAAAEGGDEVDEVVEVICRAADAEGC